MAWSTLSGRIRSSPTLLRGDPAYVAPEVLRAALDARGDGGTEPRFDGRADVFSLGLVLLEMLLAYHALDAPDACYADPVSLPPRVRAEHPSWLKLECLASRLLHFQPEEVVRRGKEVPERLRSIVSRALRVDPEERFGSAREMCLVLRTWLATLEKPFGARQARMEIAHLIEEAAQCSRWVARPSVEQGVFPPPAEGLRE